MLGAAQSHSTLARERWRSEESWLDASSSVPCKFNPSTTCNRRQNNRLTWGRVASYFQRLESLRWTPYLEECLQVLTETMEYSSDALLVQLVRSQLIVERVGQAPWHDANLDATSSAKAPTQFYLKALLAQLQELKHRMPPQLLHNSMCILDSIFNMCSHSTFRNCTFKYLQRRALRPRDWAVQISVLCQRAYLPEARLPLRQP